MLPAAIPSPLLFPPLLEMDLSHCNKIRPTPYPQQPPWCSLRIGCVCRTSFGCMYATGGCAFLLQEITDIFGKHGPISSLVVLTDDDGNSRGLAVVHYFKQESAAAAIAEWHGHVLPGHTKPLEVMYAKAKHTRAIGASKATRSPPHAPIAVCISLTIQSNSNRTSTIFKSPHPFSSPPLSAEPDPLQPNPNSRTCSLTR